MVTKVIRTNLGEVSIHRGGSEPRATFYCKDEDVTENGNGTYTISGTEGKNDADLAYTKDTKRVFMYDESIDAWWKQ